MSSNDLEQLKQRPDWIAHWSAVSLIESLRLTHEATKDVVVIGGGGRMAGTASRLIAERIVHIASHTGPVNDFVAEKQELELSLLDNVLDWKRPQVIFIGDEDNNTLTADEADLLLKRHEEQIQGLKTRICLTSPGFPNLDKFKEAASAYEFPREPETHQTMPGNRILTERRSMRKPPKSQQRMLRTQRRK